MDTLDTSMILFKHIEEQIVGAISQLPISYPCQVLSISTKKKGFVEVQTLLPQTQNDLPREIPTLRSPYLSLPIQVGDIGIALNCSYLFEKILADEKIDSSIVASRKNALFFIPLCPSTKITDENNETALSSQDSTNKVVLSSSGIEMRVGGVKSTMTNSNFDFGVQIAQSKSPIDILGSGGNLYQAFNVMIQLMDLLASGMKGSATENTAYISNRDGLITQLKAIVKE